MIRKALMLKVVSCIILSPLYAVAQPPQQSEFLRLNGEDRQVCRHLKQMASTKYAARRNF